MKHDCLFVLEFANEFGDFVVECVRWGVDGVADMAADVVIISDIYNCYL